VGVKKGLVTEVAAPEDVRRATNDRPAGARFGTPHQVFAGERVEEATDLPHAT
jgi:hypothetical protein